MSKQLSSGEAEATVEYWKAMYEAVASGVTDPSAIKAAEALVTSASSLAANTHRPFREVFTSMLEALYRGGSISASKRRKLHKRKTT